MAPLPPPFMAELPLKLPEAAPFRLFPGQLLRARVTQVGGGEVTLDFGYTSLTAKSQNTGLTVGQRVTIQIGSIGPNSLSLSILPLASPTLPQVPVSPAELLTSLGFPLDDPLIALAGRLAQQPAATGIPQPILAALVLAFGGGAEGLLGVVGRLVRGGGGRQMLPTSAAGLQAQAAGVDDFLNSLDQFLKNEQVSAAKLDQLLGHAAAAREDPAAALSLALSALAGHPVRYFGGEHPTASYLLESIPSREPGEPSAARFLGAVDLPELGPVGIVCLCAPMVCLGRLTATPAAVPLLAPQLATAEEILTDRLQRPVALTIRSGQPETPLMHWLGEHPWSHRGLAGPGQGDWIDRKA